MHEYGKPTAVKSCVYFILKMGTADSKGKEIRFYEDSKDTLFILEADCLGHDLDVVFTVLECSSMYPLLKNQWSISHRTGHCKHTTMTLLIKQCFTRSSISRTHSNIHNKHFELSLSPPSFFRKRKAIAAADSCRNYQTHLLCVRELPVTF